MMSEKLDWTQKLGDAFLAQQKDVMDTVQKLRRKAMEAGNLKTTQEQKVVVEKETIIIESPSPQVIYVPTYNPTVVYGTWPYPAYPPAYYYPPGYAAGAAMLSFGAGMARGGRLGVCVGPQQLERRRRRCRRQPQHEHQQQHQSQELSNGGRARDRGHGSTTPSTARGSPIATREPPRSITGRPPATPCGPAKITGGDGTGRMPATGSGRPAGHREWPGRTPGAEGLVKDVRT